jgi:biotin synthase
MKNLITELEQKVYNRIPVTLHEAIQLAKSENYETLFKAANRIREKFKGNKVDLCTIINAKSGKCKEDCKFCAQSVHFNTNVDIYPLQDENIIIKQAKENEKEGAYRLALVTSGKSLKGEDFDKVIKVYKRLAKETNLKLCASLGCISYEQALRLKEIGITRYHHNVETSSDYFNNICTTHSYDERVETIKNVTKAGFELCCGGIIGMGESLEDRIKLAFEVRDLGAKSIPVNILNPIKGTPLENNKPIEPVEVLKVFAVYRFINPEASIRYAGGRISLGNHQKTGFLAGVDGAIVGNLLTTLGNNILDDIKMIKEVGLTTKHV